MGRGRGKEGLAQIWLGAVARSRAAYGPARETEGHIFLNVIWPAVSSDFNLYWVGISGWNEIIPVNEGKR